MAFSEDLSVFLADFGVSVTAGAVSGSGLLDMPGELVADGMIITTDYSLRCEASKFGGLIYGAAMAVDGVNYQVRENRLIEDGAFCNITLLKVAADSSAVGQDPRTFGLADLSDVSITSAEQGDVLIYDSGQWIDANDSKSVTIAGPQAGDSFTLFRTARSTTIDEVVALVSGGSVTYELRYAADRTTAGTLATASDVVTNTTTGDSATVQNQPIAAGRFVWVEITAVSGTVEEFNLSVAF
jgi:hypothetical protein